MLAAGLDPDQFVAAAEGEAIGGYEATARLLDVAVGPDERPTALFCYNDRMAMGAFRAIADVGCRSQLTCLSSGSMMRTPSPRASSHRSRPLRYRTTKWVHALSPS